MGGILNSQGKGSPAVGQGAKALHVRGVRFENTAAKFWTCLFDEVLADFPPQTIVEMSALCGGPLVPDLLVPVNSLQRDMEKLDADAVQDAFNDALAALAVIGPPPNVVLRLAPPPDRGEAHEFLLDYLDAEVMPFLLAWLLEWAGIPDVSWNERRVRGIVTGEDHDRGFLYRASFELHAHHLSEGLYRRRVVMRFERERRDDAVITPEPGGP
jgi:hypothetical protein